MPLLLLLLLALLLLLLLPFLLLLLFFVVPFFLLLLFFFFLCVFLEHRLGSMCREPDGATHLPLLLCSQAIRGCACASPWNGSPPPTASLLVETLLAAVDRALVGVRPAKRVHPRHSVGARLRGGGGSELVAGRSGVGRPECPPLPAWCTPDAARLSERIQVVLVVAAALFGFLTGIWLTLALKRTSRAPAIALPAVWSGCEASTPRSSSSPSESARRRASVPDVAGDPEVLARLGLSPMRGSGVLTPRTRHGGPRLA